MKSKVSARDWEALSAYLDDALPPRERERLEARLRSEPALKEALTSLERTRFVLRAAPRLRAPRNFTLTPEMVAPRPSFLDWLCPTMQWSSAVAALLLVLVLAGQYLLAPLGGASVPREAPAAAPQSLSASESVEEETVNVQPDADEASPPAGKSVEPTAAVGEAADALTMTLPMPAGGQNLTAATATLSVEATPTLAPPAAATSPPPPPRQAAPAFPWRAVEGVLAFIALAGGAAAWYLGRRA